MSPPLAAKLPGRWSNSFSALFLKFSSAGRRDFSPQTASVFDTSFSLDIMETPDPTDNQLVDRTQTGDARAFDELVVRFSPRLYGLIYNMTASHEDTNDLLQEVFAKAYRSIRGFQGKSSFYTWVHTIAVNMTINFLKKRNRRKTMSLDDVENGILNTPDFIAATSNGDPSQSANLGELQKKLNESMMKLSHEHRAVVTMFDIQGMPHAEIAKILKISEGTVRSRLFYAHKQLQNHLQEFIIK
jgi:RNA polymerase sigma factor (sigma-70 family)